MLFVPSDKVTSMKPFQERVVEEKKELDSKLNRLCAFFATTGFDRLDPAERERLDRQAELMERYSAVLKERIENFKE